jgi:Fungal chitosanase of glycosyl hydrolase group 75
MAHRNINRPFVWVVAAIAGCALPATTFAQACGFQPAFQRQDERGTRRVTVYEAAPIANMNGIRPLAFVTDLKVNTDGTQRSYHQDDPRGLTRSINNVLNAMPRGRSLADFERIRDRNWEPIAEARRVLSPNVIEFSRADGKPCRSSDGYLVSMTADVAVAGGWERVGDCDQSKWIDALSTPALVLPSPVSRRSPTEFDQRGAVMRSLVVAATVNAPLRISYGIVGDRGPVSELGEASVAMNRELRGLAETDVPANYRDAIRRFSGGRSFVLIFPSEAYRVSYPLTAQRVRQESRAAFERWGGEARLRDCLREIPDARR